MGYESHINLRKRGKVNGKTQVEANIGTKIEFLSYSSCVQIHVYMYFSGARAQLLN